MNILFFSRSFPCHGSGGMEHVAWDVATGLAERGHKIKVITTATRNGNRCTIPVDLADRLNVEYLGNTHPGQYSRRWWKESRAAYIHAKDRFKPDIVFSISAGARSVLPLLEGIPSVIQVHGTSLGELLSKIRSGSCRSLVSSIRNLLYIPGDLLMLRRFNKIVAVGPNVRISLQHPLFHWVTYKDKVVMIPNGIDTEKFCPDSDAKDEIRKQLRIPANAYVFVWASRLHRQKGTHLALEAFSLLNRDDVWFLIIGDGPDRIKLQQQVNDRGITDRVVFVGNISHAKLPFYLSSGDAFVFTTMRDEGLPLNLLEAMSVNLPSIISHQLISNINIDRTKDIYPVIPDNIKDIAKGMLTAIGHEKITAGNSTFQSMSSRAFIEKNYSKKMMLDRYETLLEKQVLNDK